MSDLISVIVPAFDAASTLAETLRSAARQTYGALEMIVVDDGSRDGTADVAQRMAEADSRIRIISTANRGVGAARNAGIEAARGAFIAPLDADDIWHPRKLELQMACFGSGPPSMGLVYNWYRFIDRLGHVVERSPAPIVEGWALHSHLDWNFVSNGSTPLIRRRALGDLRYDTSLQAVGDHGCEDYLLQLQIAREHTFGCVQAYLTGYRRSVGAMSSDVGRMIRSHIGMYRILWPTLGPEARKVVRQRLAAFHAQYARNRIRRAQPVAALEATVRAFVSDPIAAPERLTQEAWRGLVYLTRKLQHEEPAPAAPRHFDAYGITERDDAWNPRRRLDRLAQLRALDERYGAERDEALRV